MVSMVARHADSALPVTAYSVVSNSGFGSQALYKGLLGGRTALKKLTLFSVDFPAYVGEVPEQLLPVLDPGLRAYSTRNARIALAALNVEHDQLRENIERVKKTYGARRIGVVIGSSTSGIYETENAYRALYETGAVSENYHFAEQHAWAATATFLQQELQLEGPCYAISTACSSSSKAIAAAQRLINSGVCDAVLSGGVDSLCRMTLHGFKSLELVSEQACTPLDEKRSGISLGEGAGLMLLERPSRENADCIHLLGTGESSDAYHMTAPHPQGKGAELAMHKALKQARRVPREIDYLNLHATGTPQNDASELAAVDRVFASNVYCSGTKGLTGHTLGAAGGIEAVIALLAIEFRFRPGSCGLNKVDPAFHSKVLKDCQAQVTVNTVMSNNYGFGGNNASLVFGSVHE